MPDVGAEHRAEASVERIRPKRSGINRIIGFTAEVEAWHEELADVFRMLDATRSEVIQRSPLKFGDEQANDGSRASPGFGHSSKAVRKVVQTVKEGGPQCCSSPRDPRRA